jgi:hypothetical protein
MNQVKTKLLFDKYPKIFAGNDLPPTKGLLCFGLECGDGWSTLLDDLCGMIQHHCNQHPEVPQVVARQVKEKLGGLRFYYDGGDEFVCGMVSMAEYFSYHVCELCGDEGERNKIGWLSVRCSTCRTLEQDGN